MKAACIYIYCIERCRHITSRWQLSHIILLFATTIIVVKGDAEASLKSRREEMAWRDVIYEERKNKRLRLARQEEQPTAFSV